jgi:C4-type Zn-finger protein
MNEGNALRADTPQCEPSLEVANNNGHSIRDTVTDIEGMIQRIEDFLTGARPEKESLAQVDSCPSGILAQICQQGANNVDRLQDIHRRLDRMAGNLGVQR